MNNDNDNEIPLPDNGDYFGAKNEDYFAEIERGNEIIMARERDTEHEILTEDVRRYCKEIKHIGRGNFQLQAHLLDRHNDYIDVYLHKSSSRKDSWRLTDDRYFIDDLQMSKLWMEKYDDDKMDELLTLLKDCFGIDNIRTSDNQYDLYIPNFTQENAAEKLHMFIAGIHYINTL